MRILNIIASADPETGGPIEALRLAGLDMARRGHSIELVTLDKPAAAYVEDFPLPVHACGRWTQRYGYTPALARWIVLNAHRFDAAVIHGLWNHASVGGGAALRRAGLPYLVFAHGMMDPWFREAYPLKHLAKQAFWLAVQGKVLRDAAAVLFTCEEERRRARGVFHGHSYAERVVAFGTAAPPNRVENQLAAFHGLLPVLKDRRFLLFLGRIHEKKGCDLLVEAFGKIASSCPDIDLVIAGPDQSGLKSKLIVKAAKAGIADRIHWPGMLAGDAKWGAFRAAEAFILPSHQENFGIVVAEAMACGTPVLLTDKVNIWREAKASGGGLVGPDTPEGIENLLRCWLSSPTTAKAPCAQMLAPASNGISASRPPRAISSPFCTPFQNEALMKPLEAKTFHPRLGGPSFPVRHRLFRLAWNLVWSLLGRWTPVPLFAWRRFLLCCFGARIDSTARVYPGVEVWYPPNLVMAGHACLGGNVICYCMDRIELGPHATISKGAHLCTGTHDIDDTEFQLVTRPITVGANAWIATEAFVGPGVTVGEGQCWAPAPSRFVISIPGPSTPAILPADCGVASRRTIRTPFGRG